MSGDPNIQVEITDSHDFHCFRLILNPNGHVPGCPAAMAPPGPCNCLSEGEGAHIEIMFHARSLVDLIHKCSLALCDWQHQTTGYLLDPHREELRRQILATSGMLGPDADIFPSVEKAGSK